MKMDDNVTHVTIVKTPIRKCCLILKNKGGNTNVKQLLRVEGVTLGLLVKSEGKKCLPCLFCKV